jgi:hypothetical protein
MSGVDTSRPPLGLRAAQALVDADVGSDDRAEDHYFEVRSDLDLTTKKDQSKLAKFILGAANRMPDDATKHFAGYGVMGIGASQGQLVGVPPIEVLDIEKAVAPFIGGEGPNCDMARVPVLGSSNEVLLLLIVDPPTWGRAPFLCHKDGGDCSKNEQLRDGAIYYRARGETREAKSGELARLLRRAKTQEKPDVQLDVRVDGVVCPIDRAALDAVLEEYITAKEGELRLALALAKQPPAANDVPVGFAAAKFPFAASGVASGFTKPENRSEDEYHAELEHWAQRSRKAWPVAVDLLLGGLLPEAEVEVANGGRVFFDDLEVVLITERSDVPQFEGTWQITALGHHAVYPGVLTVPTAEPIDVVGALREILELPDRGGSV